MNTSEPSQSVCPQCGKPVQANYTERDGSIFFDINCPGCGVTSTLLSESREDFDFWMEFEPVTAAPRVPITEGSADSECPLHCGVCENHLMTACCVLLDVTERCNQRCPYCFAKSEPDGRRSPESDPPLRTIERWYDRLLELGEIRPFNIQLSGGEPTVRDDLPEIINMGRDKGFEYIQLNTNGRHLAADIDYCVKLKEAGLSTVFLQFDGTDDSIYMALRGEPLLQIKKEAIENCAEAGLPVTLVPTITGGVNLSNIGSMINFMLENLHVVKGIHFQPVSLFGRYPESHSRAAGHQSGQAAEGSRKRTFTTIDRSPRVTMFSVMCEIENQTGGLIKYEDLRPITTGHPLCCFCGSFLREPQGQIKSLMSDKTRGNGASCCCETAPDPLEIIRRDRDFVLNKWKVGPRDGKAGPDTARITRGDGSSGAISFDDAINYFRSNQFTVSGMAFMDKSNLDAERLRRCRVQVFTKDEKLIPFCAYNSLFRV